MKKIPSFWVMKNTIGKIIDELLQKEGAPTKDDFAGMLGISVKTLYNITKGKSFLDFDQVVKASEILKYDISEEYFLRTGKGKMHSHLSEESIPYKTKPNKITVTLTVSGSLATYESFPTLLMKVRNEAKELGFDIN